MLRKNRFVQKFINGTSMLFLALAVVFLAVLYCFTVGRGAEREAKTLQYTIAAFGDSILGEYREEDSVTELLAQLLGEPVFNAALGGTSMARLDKERQMGENPDGLSMVSLSKSVAVSDFGVQQTIHVKKGATEYFDDTIDEMDQIDFGQVELLLLQHCLNDYHAGIAMENPENPYDEYTYGGAMRSTLRILKQTYPDMRILVLSPTYTWYTSQKLTCEEFDPGGGILEEYVEIQRLVAQEMQVEYLDLYHDFYPHESWEDWQLYSRDGLHPNEAGRQLIARRIADYLTEHPEKEMTP